MKPGRSVCPYCGVGCGVLVNVHRGRIAGVAGDPDHPTNRGGLCAKGQRLAEVVRARDRLLEPVVGGRGVSWPAAIEHVARGIRTAIDERGPGAVALYLSGQLLTEDYYVANKLGKGLLGTANVDTNSRLCMASTVAAYKRAFGADGPPGCYDDLEQASHVFFWGSNAADTHPILFGRLQVARRQGRRSWTVVDPRRTPTAEAADVHLAIRPGSDVALALAMAATLFQEGLIDEARTRATCSGLDEVRRTALAMPPEEAAALCGVDAGQIRAAARELASAPAALSVWCQGLNQSSAGTDKVSALINLHLLTGQIGRPGTGPFSLTGQSNAMGGREVGGMATELAAHYRLEDSQDRAAVERFWGLGPVPKERGLTAVELVDAAAERQVRVLWVVCSNPLASLPDGWAARAAFRQLDMLVVQELHHPTDTSALAHVLLPAAGWAEKTGTMTSSERRVALAEASVAPPGSARPDWEIFAEVGRAPGGGDAFSWPDAAAVFAEHVELTRHRDLDMSGLSHQLLRERGPQQWPFPDGGEPAARRYEDCRYPTRDGRARLVPLAYRPPAETPGHEFPLRLTTGRQRDQWHTMTRTGGSQRCAVTGQRRWYQSARRTPPKPACRTARQVWSPRPAASSEPGSRSMPASLPASCSCPSTAARSWSPGVGSTSSFPAPWTPRRSSPSSSTASSGSSRPRCESRSAVAGWRERWPSASASTPCPCSSTTSHRMTCRQGWPTCTSAASSSQGCRGGKSPERRNGYRHPTGTGARSSTSPPARSPWLRSRRSLPPAGRSAGAVTPACLARC